MNYLYQFTLPVFVKSLTALDQLLSKIKGQIASKNIDEASLMEAKLASDMFPFKKQIQIACDNAKGAVARLAGVEIPSHPDTETNVAELQARIKKTLDFLSTFSENSFEKAETQQITLPYFPGKYLSGFDYAREYALPNFFFHMTTAYAILRKEGFDIGKADYMGGLPLKELST